MKYLILKENSDKKEIISVLNNIKGLPEIQKRLNIYSVDKNVNIEILNNKVYIGNSNREKYNMVKNCNLKYLFKLINSISNKGFYINDIVLFKYTDVNFMFDTFHGNIISSEDSKVIDVLAEKFKLEKYNSISEHKQITKVSEEMLFDEIGNLNIKIKKYANETGLDIRSVSSSLKIRLSNVSNDYSYLEKFYELITGEELLSFNNYTSEYNFKKMSIVIPTFNTDLTKTLLSIQSQNLTKKEKEMIQVIIVDDGSDTVIKECIDKIRKSLDFELNIIVFNKNMGLSDARNAGVSIAKNDMLLFIDSDIILSKNYLKDVNIRLQIIPNAIFVSMRKNIDKDDEFISEKSIKEGIERTLDFDDSRVVTNAKEYHIGWDNEFLNETISILDDTNYFKELSYGSKIGIYDLPSVVTGHNIAINRKTINKYPLFSNKFKGWGMEDAYFASEQISNGCYIIPLLSSCVYHINHPPRSGSMEKKSLEAKTNHKLYNDMLNQKW